MYAWEVMSKPVIRASSSTPVQDAAALLVEHGFAALPVVDDQDNVIGIFTEADALRSGLVTGELAAGAQVADYMTRSVDSVPMEAPVEQLARRMLQDRRRCIPIEKDGVLVGVVSRRDVLRPFFRHAEAIRAELRSLLAAYGPHTARWDAEITGGVATITGEFANETERELVHILATSVPGVVRTEIRDKQFSG